MPGSAPPVAERQLSFREVLRVTVMRRTWYAQIISLLGDVLALFAVISVATFRMHATPDRGKSGLDRRRIMPGQRPL